MTQKEVGARLGLNQQTVGMACLRFSIKSPKDNRKERAVKTNPSHHIYHNKIKDKSGYCRIFAPNHPMASKSNNGYILEHRVVMSDYIGRVLDKTEIVHHINRDRADNRIENLMLISSKSEHSQLHQKEGDNAKRIWSPQGMQNMQVARHRGHLLGIMTDPRLWETTKKNYLTKTQAHLVCPLLSSPPTVDYL